jgi:hypothetical protein
MSTEFESENTKNRDHLDDLAEDGRMILKWIFIEYGGMD